MPVPSLENILKSINSRLRPWASTVAIVCSSIAALLGAFASFATVYSFVWPTHSANGPPIAQPEARLYAGKAVGSPSFFPAQEPPRSAPLVPRLEELRQENLKETATPTSSEKSATPEPQHKIVNQHRQETGATPKFLRDQCKEKSYDDCKAAVSPFVGKWMTASGIVQRITGHTRYDDYDVTLGSTFESFDSISLSFDEQYREFFVGLKERQKLKALCQLTRATAGFIMLEHCEQPSVSD